MPDSTPFTLIVPTRERSATLFHCLRTLVAQDYGNVCILVSDNFSQDDTRDVVHGFKDKRIRYVNTGRRVSMSHNWEFALSFVTDGWVSIIGDDDGLMPFALRTVADIVAAEDCEALATRRCLYNWPDIGASANELTVPVTDGVEIRDARQWLGKLVRSDTVFQELPCLYTGGFVHARAIARARGQGGRFFYSMTPDVYSSIAIASVVDRYVLLKEPVAIGGTSSYSGGYSFFEMGNNKKPAEAFFSEPNLPIHPMLSLGIGIKSLPFWVYESYLQAHQLHNDFLGVSMAEQLAIAVARSAPQHRSATLIACHQIADANRIDPEQFAKAQRAVRGRMLHQQLARVPSYILDQMVLGADKFGVRDVYGAALLAEATKHFRRGLPNWRWANLRRLAGRFFPSR